MAITRPRSIGMSGHAVGVSDFRERAQRLIACAAATAASTLLLPAALACAADQPAATKSSQQSLQEVVVTATRRKERLVDVPVSVSVLKGTALVALGSSGQDIRQLAFAVPSLNVESSNGRTFPRFYIRGYGNTDFTSFASQPVGLYYDGIDQENPALKGFPIFDEEDIEVLRGPQGTLFGRNSPAGVVKITSNPPVIGQYSGLVSASDGTYDTAVVEGVVNLPINDKMAFRLSTQEQHRDNWVNAPFNPPGDQHLDGYDDWATRMQLLYKPSDDFSALVNVHGRTLGGSARLFRANDITQGTNSLVPNFNPAALYTDGYNGQSYSSVGGNAHLAWTTPDFTYLSITGYESIPHYNTIGDIDGGYGPGFFSDPCVLTTPGSCASHWGPGFIPFAAETGGESQDYQLTQEFRVLSNRSGPLQEQAGIFLFDEHVKATGNDYAYNSLALTDTTISRQKNNSEAIYGSVKYAFTRRFNLRVGGRFTWDAKTFAVPYTDVAGGLPPPLSASEHASKFDWDASPTYAISPNVNLYARVATGFRAPSFGAPSAGPPPTPVQVAKSEDIISYETGIKGITPDHRTSVAFDVYYFHVTNQQLTAVGGISDVTELLNAKDTYGRGAELAVQMRPLPALLATLSGSYNYTRIDDPGLAVAPCFNFAYLPGGAHCTELNPLNAEGNALINGNPLPEAPKWTGDFSLRYAVALRTGGSMYFYTDMSYRSDMNFFLDKELEFVGPPLYQLGLRLGYTWDEDKYEVAAFCRNCTDQIRNIGGINFDNFTGMINDPRIVGGQVSMKF